jgi:hypothetical protein
MGTYYPDPQAVIDGDRGRKLEDKPEQSYESYTSQLEEGESLWLGTDNGRWPLVILVDTPPEFQYVMSHREGKGAYTFYALAAT